MKISKRDLLTRKGNHIDYYLIEFNKLNVHKLVCEPDYAVSDFADFRHSSSLDYRPLVSSKAIERSNAQFDTFQSWFSVENVECFNLRSAIQTTFSIGAKQNNFPAEPKKWEQFREVCTSNGFLAIRSDFDDLKPLVEQPLFLGDFGYLSMASKQFPKAACLASGYSLVNNFECLSRYQAIRDPIGLRASNGQILNIPVYGRPCFLQKDCGESEIVRLDSSSASLLLEVEDGRCFEVRNISISSGTQPYFVAADNEIKATPKSQSRVDLLISQGTVAARILGGGTLVGYSGVIISCSSESDLGKISDHQNTKVKYKIDAHDGIVSGLQCGPTLVDFGKQSEIEMSLRNEKLSKSSEAFKPAPTSLHLSCGNVKAARSAIAVGNEKLFAIVIPGSNTSASRASNIKSYGATFDELAEVCLSEGALTAMAMDSGGSVGLHHNGSPVFSGGDFRNSFNRTFERPLAHSVVLT